MSAPRIAVLTLTRDRLEYTKHCFAALRENAGCDYDHWVLDQGSTDGTSEWLDEQYELGLIVSVKHESENIGIHRGMNWQIFWAESDYDLLVKIDNDCELVTPGCLKAVADHVLSDTSLPRVVSPLVTGLRNRPVVEGIVPTDQGPLGLTGAIGGLFMPIPPLFLAEGFRYDETAPIWGGDDERICAMAEEDGGYSGYLLDYEVRHYRTTDGQAAEQVAYFARRVMEGGPPR